MKKSLVISEHDSIAAILENERVVEFFVNRGELLLGDIYTATVENILPGIDAAFVNLGKDKMGFLHANDVPGTGPLKERLVPKQKLLVQITKEPTGHKGPRVSTAISLPGRFLVLVPEERGISISRRISEARERARLKSVVNLMKPPGVGLIIRTEAKGQGEGELFEDFEALWDRWQSVVSDGEASIGPTLIYRDQDLLYRVIRDAYSHEVTDIIVDSPDGQRRAQEYLQGWASKQTKVSFYSGEDTSLLVSKGIDREIEAALSDRVELPSGGHLNIQPTEALTVIDVNSGRFTSSRTQAETVRRTNLEAAQEISRQLRLRNIGGMVIVDFIDMDSRKDQQQVLEVFQRALEEDRAKPQIGQLSDLGLVELTRRRQGQSLRELFTVHCSNCAGLGVVPTLEIGPAENRRIISFKPREEEPSKRQGGKRSSAASRASGGMLRAATASNGRIMPTVEAPAAAEEEFDEALGYVPEEIMEQVPDDLLDRPSGKQLKHPSFVESEDDEDIIEADEEVTVELQAENFTPKTSLFEESFSEDDDSLSENLEDHISAVARVSDDMGRTGIRTSTAAEEPDEVVILSSESDSSRTNLNPNYTVEIEQEESVQEEEYRPFSPYEAEVDPVTGIYRLKTKPADEGESQPHEHSSQAGGYGGYGDENRNYGDQQSYSQTTSEQDEQESAGQGTTSEGGWISAEQIQDDEQSDKGDTHEAHTHEHDHAHGHEHEHGDESEGAHQTEQSQAGTEFSSDESGQLHIQYGNNSEPWNEQQQQSNAQPVGHYSESRDYEKRQED